jgi:triosephosphate isomerase
MNLRRSEAVELARAIAQAVPEDRGVDVAVCPPSVYLEAVVGSVTGSPVGVGGQNVYHEPDGAYTGELSAGMLKDIGCRYVILGHSERRNILGESSQLVNSKVLAALAAELTPIVCVGELLAEREAGQTMEVITRQFDETFAGLSAEQMVACVIAYEPVWAIGTGKVATPDQAEEVHQLLRDLLENRYNSTVAAGIPIQYGGSVKPDNAGQLLGQPNIDGALVGGAALKADSFLAIVAAAGAPR